MPRRRDIKGFCVENKDVPPRWYQEISMFSTLGDDEINPENPFIDPMPIYEELHYWDHKLTPHSDPNYDFYYFKTPLPPPISHVIRPVYKPFELKIGRRTRANRRQKTFWYWAKHFTNGEQADDGWLQTFVYCGRLRLPFIYDLSTRGKEVYFMGHPLHQGAFRVMKPSEMREFLGRKGGWYV